MAPAPSWRAPAVPLVVHDPYLSVWSASDELTAQWPVHWSGQPRPIAGMAWIDGEPFRFIGKNTPLSEVDIPAMRQTRISVLPTSTTYDFEAGGIELALRFTSPVLPDDLDVLARPVTYVDCTVRALDGREHEVSLYLDVAAVWAVAMPEQRVIWGRHRAGDVETLWVGSKDQAVLERASDEIGIEWGYLHLSAAPGQAGAGAIGEGKTLRADFARTGRIEARDDVGFGVRLSMPAPAASVTRPNEQGFEEGRPPLIVVAASAAPRSVGAQALTSSFLIAYDQGFAVEYFGRRLRPLWYESAGSALGLIERAWAERESLLERSARFDADLWQEAEASGGTSYARLASLAFRQCLGGHALVRDHDGRLLHFSKENSSNGCMGTVDVLYPASPFFLLFNPALLEAQLEPILALASSPAWPFRSRRTTSAGSRLPTARSTAAACIPRTARCRSRSAATCCSAPPDWRRSPAARRSRAAIGRRSKPGPTTCSSTASTRRSSSAPTTSPVTSPTTPTSRSRPSSRWPPSPSCAPKGG